MTAHPNDLAYIAGISDGAKLQEEFVDAISRENRVLRISIAVVGSLALLEFWWLLRSASTT